MENFIESITQKTKDELKYWLFDQYKYYAEKSHYDTELKEKGSIPIRITDFEEEVSNTYELDFVVEKVVRDILVPLTIAYQSLKEKEEIEEQ